MSKAEKQLPHDALPARQELKSITFGDLDNKPIKFYSEHRPFKRCLRFHAQQASCYPQHVPAIIPRPLYNR